MDPETKALEAVERAVSLETVQDGEPHPAEPVLAKFVVAFGAKTVALAIFADSAKPHRTASFLRLVGRIPNVSVEDRRLLASRGLASPEDAVRDAALQALETWDDKRLEDLVEGHADPTPYLALYAHSLLKFQT